MTSPSRVSRVEPAPAAGERDHRHVGEQLARRAPPRRAGRAPRGRARARRGGRARAAASSLGRDVPVAVESRARSPGAIAPTQPASKRGRHDAGELARHGARAAARRGRATRRGARSSSMSSARAVTTWRRVPVLVVDVDEAGGRRRAAHEDRDPGQLALGLEVGARRGQDRRLPAQPARGQRAVGDRAAEHVARRRRPWSRVTWPRASRRGKRPRRQARAFSKRRSCDVVGHRSPPPGSGPRSRPCSGGGRPRRPPPPAGPRARGRPGCRPRRSARISSTECEEAISSLLQRRVDAVVAGAGGGRAGDAQVHLARPRLAHHAHDLARGGAAHDRVVDQHHPPALDAPAAPG